MGREARRTAAVIGMASLMTMTIGAAPAMAAATSRSRAARTATPSCTPQQGATRYVAPPAGYLINPAVTEAGITPAQSTCYWDMVYPHKTATVRGLYLFLGGKDSPTSSSTMLASSEAAAGFDVIDLAYDRPTDGDGVDQLCRGQSTAAAADTCYSDLRGEISYGDGVSFDDLPAGGYSSPYATVDAPDSILGRAVALLDYLGWTRYLTADSSSPYSGMTLNGSAVTIAGGSAGTGYAAFIAHQFTMAGVDLFSGPSDDDETGVGQACPDPQPASWTATSVTPSSAYFAFNDTSDVNLPCTEGDLRSLGLAGPPTLIAAGFPATGVSDELTTDAGGSCTSSPPDSYHTCPYDDFTTPLKAARAAAFGPVWQWMSEQ